MSPLINWTTVLGPVMGLIYLIANLWVEFSHQQGQTEFQSNDETVNKMKI